MSFLWMVLVVAATPVEPPRVTCVGTAIEKWRLPAADAGTLVEWDFSFTSIDAGAPVELESLALEGLGPRWGDDAVRCYDSTRVRGDKNGEGRLTLDLVVTRHGAVVDATTGEVSPALAGTLLSRV